MVTLGWAPRRAKAEEAKAFVVAEGSTMRRPDPASAMAAGRLSVKCEVDWSPSAKKRASTIMPEARGVRFAVRLHREVFSRRVKFVLVVKRLCTALLREGQA